MKSVQLLEGIRQMGNEGIPTDPIGRTLFAIGLGSGGDPDKLLQLMNNVKEIKTDFKELIKVRDTLKDINSSIRDLNQTIRDMNDKL